MIINTPDGPVNFPDTMSMPDIEAALQKLYPPAVAQAQSEMSQMTQHPGAAIAEQRRQQDVADYAALPAWKRPVADTLDLVNTTGRAAAGLVTGTLNLGSKALAATGAGTPVISVTPEEVMARFRSGQSSGPAFDAELAYQKRQTEASRNRLQWAAPIAEALPMAMLPVARVAKGLPLLNTTVTGAGYGTLTAAGDKENLLLGALSGAAGAAGGHILGQGLGWALNKGLGVAGKVADYFAPKLAAKTGLKVLPPPPIMTKEEFKAASKVAFDEADAHGVVFNRDGLQHLGQNIVKDLNERSWDPGNEPGVSPVLKRLNAYLQTGNVTFKGLRSLRRLAQNGWRKDNASNNAAIAAITSHIDDLTEKMDPAHMASSSANPEAAHAAAKAAREMYSKGAQLDTIQKAVQRGEDIGGSNMSRNVAQSVGKQLLAIVNPKNPAASRGFSAAGKQAIRDAAKAANREGIAQHVAKAVGPVTGAELLGHVAMAGHTGGASLIYSLPMTGARLLAGHIAQKQAAKIAERSVEDLVHIIATGGLPRREAQSLLQRLTESKRAAVLAGLGRAGMGFGNAAAHQLYRANSQNEPAHP